MRHWLRSYRLLLQWTLLRMRVDLPLLVIVQIAITVGIVIGFAFLMPFADPESAFYLTTGAMTISLITVGMVIAPQVVSQQKFRGIFDYQRSMPVPRMAMLSADATVWVAISLPGLVIALGVAAVRFDLSFDISPLVVPAVLLVAAGSVAVGYAIAYLAKPSLTGIITNLITVVSLMFAPINFPADRLPEWLASVHQVLPFEYMAQAIRETVKVPAVGISPMPFAVLGAWSVLGLAITSRIMTRRT